MSEKKASLIAFTLFAAIGAIGMKLMWDLKGTSQYGWEPAMWPFAVCCILFALSALEIVITLCKHGEDEHLDFGNIKNILYFVILSVIFFAVWFTTGSVGFYIASFFYLLAMLIVFSTVGRSWKRILTRYLPIALGTELFFYVVFAKVMLITF